MRGPSWAREPRPGWRPAWAQVTQPARPFSSLRLFTWVLSSSEWLCPPGPTTTILPPLSSGAFPGPAVHQAYVREGAAAGIRGEICPQLPAALGPPQPTVGAVWSRQGHRCGDLPWPRLRADPGSRAGRKPSESARPARAACSQAVATGTRGLQEPRGAPGPASGVRESAPEEGTVGLSWRTRGAGLWWSSRKGQAGPLRACSLRRALVPQNYIWGDLGPKRRDH